MYRGVAQTECSQQATWFSEKGRPPLSILSNLRDEPIRQAAAGGPGLKQRSGWSQASGVQPARVFRETGGEKNMCSASNLQGASNDTC